MSDAYVETTILTDILLKPNSNKQRRARAALAKYEKTILPVYSIKEWKDGPLGYFAYVHDKLVLTQSLADTIQVVAALSPYSYRKATSTEALAAAGQTAKKRTQKRVTAGTSDKDGADSYRLALVSLILRSWQKRRKITSEVVGELPCYVEASPRIGKDGLFDLEPRKCDRDQECCLAVALKSQRQTLESLRDAIPKKSVRREDQKRRQALRQLIRHPEQLLDRDTCRDLGDAIFAFFCPPKAVVLTTNIREAMSLWRRPWVKRLKNHEF